MIDVKRLIVNAALAGFWAGLTALSVSGELSDAALWAAGIAAVRAAVGYLAGALGHAVPVDATADR